MTQSGQVPGRSSSVLDLETMKIGHAQPVWVGTGELVLIMAGHRQRLRANFYLTLEFSFHSAAATSQFIVDVVLKKRAISEPFRSGVVLMTPLLDWTEVKVAQLAPLGRKVDVNSFGGRCRFLQTYTLRQYNLVVNSGQLKKVQSLFRRVRNAQVVLRQTIVRQEPNQNRDEHKAHAPNDRSRSHGFALIRDVAAASSFGRGADCIARFLESTQQPLEYGMLRPVWFSDQSAFALVKI